MCTILQIVNLLEGPAFAAITDMTAETWFAVHTYARHEKVVAQEARDLGITTFLADGQRSAAMVGPAQGR